MKNNGCLLCVWNIKSVPRIDHCLPLTPEYNIENYNTPYLTIKDIRAPSDRFGKNSIPEEFPAGCQFLSRTEYRHWSCSEYFRKKIIVAKYISITRNRVYLCILKMNIAQIRNVKLYRICKTHLSKTGIYSEMSTMDGKPKFSNWERDFGRDGCETLNKTTKSFVKIVKF